ncbi:MAG: phosphotriesterase-related protein, partial [Dehalococcoidia bacterium]
VTHLSGKVQTVLGRLSPDELGITLPHEHFLIDIRNYFEEPAVIGDLALAYQPIALENLDWVRHHPLQSKTNMVLDDEREAIEEALVFGLAGGQTIVDCSERNHKRDPRALMRISKSTGLNVVMGTGYYVWPSHGPDMDNKSEDEIYQEFVQDIVEGVDGTGIKAGIIGEIGISSPMHPNEEKTLRAGARAQKSTGAAIYIHSPRDEKDPLKVVNLLTNLGADPQHIVMCDVDRTLLTHERRLELAKTGCFLEWDHFGQLDYYFRPEIDMPNDRYRVRDIIELAQAGYLSQVLMSHDICQKVMRRKYGGHGYAHILQYIVPVMRAKGMRNEEINTILIENPKRLLTGI